MAAQDEYYLFKGTTDKIYVYRVSDGRYREISYGEYILLTARGWTITNMAASDVTSLHGGRQSWSP